ncbi:MAG: BTAD domain-containing putative transcriptional regulator [Methylophagaceae bacterium]
MTVHIATNAAKISRPKISGMYPRHRLNKRLDEFTMHPGTWISSPPGAGKTALICNYLELKNEKTVWLKVDEGDSELATFFYYLGQAVKKSTPRKKDKIPIFTPEYREGLAVFTRNFFRTVFSRFSSKFTFVFDNYQDVAADSDLHKLIVIAHEELPDNGSIITISRSLPPSAFSRLRANNHLCILEWDQLKLTDDEMEEFFTLKGLSQEHIPSAMALTQGWIAGLALLLEQDNEEIFQQKQLSEFNPKLLFDYFVGEIFDIADDETQHLLAKTALFPKMTIKMAIQISGIQTAASILDSLVAKNFFTYQHGNKEKSYEYHPLFREFLLNKSEQLMGDVELKVTKWNAAELLEKNSQIESAIELYSQLEDWDKVASVIKKTAKSLIVQGRNFILQEWLTQIPEPQMHEDPWLIYWLALTTKAYSPLASFPLFEKAHQLFKDRNDVTGIYLSWAGVLDSLRMDHMGDATRLDLWFARLEILRKEYPEFPSDEIELEVAINMLMALWWRQPQNKSFYYWQERALATVASSEKRNEYTIWLNSIMVYQLLMISGEPMQAANLIDQTWALVDKEESLSQSILWFHIANNLLFWRGGQFDLAYEHIDKGLEVGKITGFHHEDHQLLVLGASVALTEEKLPLAKHYIDQLDITDLGAQGSRYHYVQSWYYFLQGDLGNAKYHGEISVKIAETAGMPYFHLLHCLGLADIYFSLGEYGASSNMIKTGRNIAEEINAVLLIYSALLLEAKFSFAQNQYQLGIEHLKKALIIGRERAYIKTSFVSNKEMAQLCVEALKANIEVDYIQMVIQKLHLTLPEGTTAIDNWPWPVKIMCLGKGFEIIKDNQLILTSRKAQKKPLEIIKVLIALGGDNIPESKIVETIWPESDGDAGHQSIATTLHRLRKIVGEDIIELKDSRLSINKNKVWVDAWEFDKLCDSKQTESNSTLLDKSIALYKGLFLAGETDLYWSLTLRDKLHHKYIKLIKQKGHQLEQSNKWHQACELYQQGLEIDDVTEQFYQRLMYCYIHMERAGEAVKTYRQCFQVLNKRLGIEPSNITKELYAKAML